MTTTLSDYCDAHVLPFVYVYHVHGLDWCATNSPEFKVWFDAAGTDAQAYKKLLFGSVPNDGFTGNNFSAWDVKCIANLDNDVGSQSIKYKRDKGINVGTWSVTVSGGEHGYTWDKSSVECWGVMGLDCQPDITSIDAKSSILSQDYQPDSTSSFLDIIYWDKSRDNGLATWITNMRSGSLTPYLWVGSSCVAVVGAVTTSGDEYHCISQACQFNTPLELVHNRDANQLITITNFPQSIAGMTASLYGVPFDKEAGSLIGDSTELPILLRTGKAQTNFKSDGKGQWKIGACGATEQLKYETVAASAAAQLHGFHFSRNTLIGSANYDIYGRAQQPHLWVFETNISTINSNIVEQGGFEESSLSAWSTGALAILSASTTSPYEGAQCGSVICDTGGIDVYAYQSILVVGQRYKITSAKARGDNTAYPQLKCGDTTLWTGDTSTSWQNIPVIEFTATSTELRLYTSVGTVGDHTEWDKIKLETAEINVGQLWLGNMSEGDSLRYDTLTEVRDAAITELNRATTAGDLSCNYQLVDGDLVYASPSSDEYSVQIFGPAAFVCGFGYIDVSKYVDAIEGMIAPNSAPPWSLNRGNHWGGTSASEEDLLFEDTFGTMNFSKVPYWCHIRSTTDPGATSIKETKGWLDYGVPVSAVLKNYSSCAYYYQWLFDETPFLKNAIHVAKVPEDSSGNHRFYYNLTGDANFEVDDVISIGKDNEQNPPAMGTVSAVGTSGNINYITVNYESPAGTTATDYTYGMPESIQWVTGWKEAYDNGVLHKLATHLLGLSGRDLSDPYPISDKTSVEASGPVDIIKQLLGDPDTDVGVPRGMRCTDINNLWGLHSGDRKLIDFDKFESLVSSAGVDGAQYKLKVDSETDSTTGIAEVNTINTLDIINGTCLTHGIKQCWEYNEEQRAWWLTFKPYFGDSLANASNEGRVLDSTQEVNMRPTGQAGGQWLYSSIFLELPVVNGDKEVFNIGKSVGRYKHSIGSKKLTVKDKLTNLPIGGDTAKNSVINTMANYLNLFATVHYQQKATTKLSALTRFVVGGGVLVDLDHILYRPQGKRRYGEQYANVEAMTINLGPRANVSVDLLTAAIRRTGIGPSMFVDTFTRTDTAVSVTGLATTNGNSYFVPTGNGMTDLATFGCWSWSVSNNAFKKKGCSCGNYAIWIIERNQEASTDAGASRNVWAATITQPTATTLAAGTATITLADSTNFPADSTGGRSFVIIFEDRDKSTLQPCQYDLYGWLGDADGNVTDSSSDTLQAITIGG